MSKTHILITAALLSLLLAACSPSGELQALQTQVTDLQSELESAQGALEDAQAQVAALEERGSELEAALAEVDTDLSAAAQDAEALEETLEDDLEDDLDADGDADVTDAEVETANDVIEDLTSTQDEDGLTASEDAEQEDLDAELDDEADGAEDTDDLQDEPSEDVELDDAEPEDVDAEDSDAEDGDSENSGAEDSEDASEEEPEDEEDLEDESSSDAGAEVVAAAAGAAALANLPEEAQEGGSVSVAITAEPPGWDPSVSTSQEIPRVMYHNVYEGLVRFNEAGDIVPALAESWDVSDDGLTWTFELREGVSYHDGSSFSADDVVAKFERATDSESGHTNPQYYEAIESVEAEGNAVTFTLSEPSSSLLYNLARPDSIIYPAALTESQVTDPVGTGPFKFAEYTEGSEVRLERFEDYYLPGVPILDEAIFRIIPDENTRFAALQSGDIDLIGTSLAPEQFQELESLEGVTGAQGDATTEITLALNNNREPLNDPLVRQAITHAIDKNVIVEGAMFGLGTVIGSHVSPSESYFVDLEPYPYDPERARELLAEAGYEEGLELTFELPEPYNIERRAGEVIAQQLAEVGIDIDLQVVEWGTWIQRIFLGSDYDMTIIGHSEPRDINVYGNPDYYYGYDNEAVRELLSQIEQTTDTDEQNQLFVQIAETIAEDAVNVWVFAPPYLVAAREDVGGYWTNQPTPSIDITGMYRLEN